jgi:hypothetical protein
VCHLESNEPDVFDAPACFSTASSRHLFAAIIFSSKRKQKLKNVKKYAKLNKNKIIKATKMLNVVSSDFAIKKHSRHRIFDLRKMAFID